MLIYRPFGKYSFRIEDWLCVGSFFDLTAITFFWNVFSSLQPPDWVCLPVLHPYSQCAVCLSPLHHSEVIYNACGVVAPCIPPHWSSNKPPAVNSDCCLSYLPIIHLAPSAKQRERQIVFIEKGREIAIKRNTMRVIS